MYGWLKELYGVNHMATRKELADLAVKLFDNIDQADQFDPYPMFYHCDKKFLLHLISNMLDSIEQNDGRYTIMSEDELAEVVAKAQKVLGREST